MYMGPMVLRVIVGIKLNDNSVKTGYFRHRFLLIIYAFSDIISRSTFFFADREYSSRNIFAFPDLLLLDFLVAKDTAAISEYSFFLPTGFTFGHQPTPPSVFIV
jgi:hypothetical protein